MREVRVFAPATVANVASGFDIFGFALEEPGDIVTARFRDGPGVQLKIIGDGGQLPLDPNKNSVGIGVLALLKHLNVERGIEIELEKKMPFGSGLGSSAASAAGGVFAVNELLDKPMTKKDLVPFALEAEKAVSGTLHADNVAPAILGGFILVRSYSPLDLVEIEVKIDLFCTIFLPDMQIRTEEARALLKKEIPLESFVIQTGNAAGLIAGLLKGDEELFGRSLKDHVIEPMRAGLVPGFYEIQKAAMDKGALGCSLSGSGPAIFALSKDKERGSSIGLAMKSAAKKRGMEGCLYYSCINKEGTRVL